MKNKLKSRNAHPTMNEFVDNTFGPISRMVVRYYTDATEIENWLDTLVKLENELRAKYNAHLAKTHPANQPEQPL